MKKDFPLLDDASVVYLDSAATTQKPKVVIDAMNEYYTKHNANIHRGLYALSEHATQMYEASRKKVADFIAASAEEIVFTKNATEAINIVANGLSALTERREIVLTELEHHANLVPWLQLKGFSIKYIPLKGYDIDYEAAETVISEKTALVALTHISNVFGTRIDVARVAALAKEKGALILVDGAQSLSHIPVDVESIGCDFFACSAHKAFGPMGVGVLYGKKVLLEKLPPYTFGGDMIETVSYSEATWAPVPQKFEAGTQNVAGVIGFGAAIEYIQSVGFDAIQAHDSEIITYALEALGKIPGITLYHAGVDTGVATVSFTVERIHPHDIASLLADKGICIRGGHHCAMPLMTKLGLEGTARASFSLYNTKEDVDALVAGIKHIQEVFNG